MGIPTATKITIIATSRNVLAHAHIDYSFFIIIFFYLKHSKQSNTKNKLAYGLERFNTSFHQKTSWVEEHCYELLHSNKTEMNIINNYYTLNNIKIIIQILFLLFIYLLKLEIQTALF